MSSCSPETTSLPAAMIGWCRGTLVGLGIITAVVNLLALTGSLYMLQVYDRVLGSHSTATLLALTLLMAGLYGLYGVLDVMRSRVLVRLGGRADRGLRKGVFDIVLASPLQGRPMLGLQAVRDLDQVRAAATGPGLVAVFDAPWLPVFLAMLFVLHPWLGWLAVAGAAVMVATAVTAERRASAPAEALEASATRRMALLDLARRNAEVVRALGLAPALRRRWEAASEDHLADTVRAVEAPGSLATFARVFRMALQSLMLGLGAWVVLRGEATGGIMIAASVMTGRALAPIETVTAQWRSLVAARQAWRRLGAAIAPTAAAPRTDLPAPRATLTVESLVVVPPGAEKPTLHGITFGLKAGDGLGIIGPSASGKSTLARALVGVFAARQGTVRLDGATLDQWRPETIGSHIGYLPQDVEIFEGTVAENIARLDDRPDSAAVIAAARAAGCHDMIVALPRGYDTPVGPAGAVLSAGQRQRLALARALYRDPFLIVLDEPNANLDASGEAALSAAIAASRRRGAVVVVVAHRPAAIAELDQLLVLNEGRLRSFGPRDKVLAQTTHSASPTLAVVGGSSRDG
ncbi:type I secretion system permease/ATPase [Rhodoplanes sp. TEM]|uniref:Type I secretion system permease/ATPase n=1 Tax=Rhodoplanes tepidamans TaxID=200616 RepID=A0ABT5JI84_RHOTP|nr:MULTISPECIES: type I secretion system permease/ATPase [Rhodoplanes]MDC7789435.1 type I secretion system permease/ATPase [Rhodoplanes tepidamans]MDC7985428.1 type I secretion system permease/ATPase [Rhodoplanes sp. TEM]MDQ0353608.1 ATP-binding cassette subfamily C protein [Rhodoplanes tepidamans]